MRVYWCEQSGVLEDRSSFIGALESAGVQFFRLNWRHGSSDPFANVSKDSENISWSRGRQILFDHVKQLADADDYIVFADDDVSFQDMTVGDAARIISSSLAENRPLCAAVNSSNWHISRYERFLNRALRRRSYQVFCADLEIQIMRRDFADIVFPVVFDGGYGTLWYPYFLNNRATKSGTFCISGLTVINTRANLTGNYGGELNGAAALIWQRCSAVLPWTVRFLVGRFGLQRGIIYYNALMSFRRPRRAKFDKAHMIALRQSLQRSSGS
jgi:hypothetical protein